MAPLGVDERLTKRIKLVGSPVHPVIKRGSGKPYPGIRVHLHLTVFGNMVDELVDKRSGLEVGPYMSPAKHRDGADACRMTGEGALLSPFFLRTGRSTHSTHTRAGLRCRMRSTFLPMMSYRVRPMPWGYSVRHSPDVRHTDNVRARRGAPFHRLFADFPHRGGYGGLLGLGRLVEERVEEDRTLHDTLVAPASPEQVLEIGYPLGHAPDIGLEFLICRSSFHAIKILIFSEIDS